ncbi:MAG: ribulose-phosphate 3-epimerase [Elusimicrobia bacterium]|nr:ribulose-phosphate 3-epimerase [Elusimicrobiota bacterium]
MDGDFVPNLSFGPDVVKGIVQKTSFFIDVHLMVSRPKRLIKAFADKGADLITVHLEAKDSAKECLKLINDFGKYAGLAINPATPFSRAMPYLGLADLLLIMTVAPGFAGQGFMNECIPKIRQAAKHLRGRPMRTRWLEVDGGVNEASIPDAVGAGANVLVCGSALFKEPPDIMVPRMWRAIRRGLKKCRI